MQAECETKKRDASTDLELCETATPGPWSCVCDEVEVKVSGVTARIVFVKSLRGEADARFIAEARQALPYWIQQAVAAETEVERLKAENARVVALAGAGYEKLVMALQTIAKETDDPGARECAEDALESNVRA